MNKIEKTGIDEAKPSIFPILTNLSKDYII